MDCYDIGPRKCFPCRQMGVGSINGKLGSKWEIWRVIWSWKPVGFEWKKDERIGTMCWTCHTILIQLSTKYVVFIRQYPSFLHMLSFCSIAIICVIICLEGDAFFSLRLSHDFDWRLVQRCPKYVWTRSSVILEEVTWWRRRFFSLPIGGTRSLSLEFTTAAASLGRTVLIGGWMCPWPEPVYSGMFWENLWAVGH